MGETQSCMQPRTIAALALVTLSLGILYAGVATGLVHAWYTNDDYSHGFVVAPLCAYFVWERRRRLARLDLRPSLTGLAIVLASLMVLTAGELGAELFLMRVSLIGVLVGSVTFVLGPAHARTLALPFGFALLMIPLPAIVFNAIAFPLQLMASRVAEGTLAALAIPVFREGNVILLATATLEVAEACSGIRSLFSLLTLGIAYGYFTESTAVRRVVLAAATVPIAIVANAFRVAGTGVLAHVAGPAAADGFFHVFAGWLVFMTAVVLLFLLQRLLRVADVHAPQPQIVGEVTP
jgi:exosortase